MDDARLANEMTLDGIAKQLTEIRADLSEVKADLGGVKADLSEVKADLGGVKADLGGVKAGLGGLKEIVAAGFQKVDDRFTKVDEQLGASRLRDEELRSLAKLGLEANQGLLETTTARFDATDKKQGEEIGLLKDVLRGSVK